MVVRVVPDQVARVGDPAGLVRERLGPPALDEEGRADVELAELFEDQLAALEARLEWRRAMIEIQRLTAEPVVVSQ